MTIIIKDKFKIVKPDEGYILTTYVEGNDIKLFNAASEIICPLDADLSNIREVTIEESKNYIKKAKNA